MTTNEELRAMYPDTPGTRHGLVYGEPAECPSCHVTTSNGPMHLCVEYDDAHPCSVCGAGTVFVMIAAPGTGSGRECANGHYVGTCRELTIDEVR